MTALPASSPNVPLGCQSVIKKEPRARPQIPARGKRQVGVPPVLPMGYLGGHTSPMRDPAEHGVPRPPGGKALARLVSELTRVGLDVHAEAAALFGAPGEDPVELVADVAGPGYVSPGPYLGDGLVERVAERYHRVAEELTAQDAADQPAWRCLGPMMIPNGQTRSDQPGARVDVSGRVAAIAVDPRDPEHILVGAAGGGIWES